MGCIVLRQPCQRVWREGLQMKQEPKKEREGLKKAAAHWQRLADDEPRDTTQSIERYRLYNRTAESLRLQMKDGVARCACCLLPYGRKECDGDLIGANVR